MQGSKVKGVIDLFSQVNGGPSKCCVGFDVDAGSLTVGAGEDIGNRACRSDVRASRGIGSNDIGSAIFRKIERPGGTESNRASVKHVRLRISNDYGVGDEPGKQINVDLRVVIVGDRPFSVKEQTISNVLAFDNVGVRVFGNIKITRGHEL